jgi:hypothetical protein
MGDARADRASTGVAAVDSEVRRNEGASQWGTLGARNFMEGEA